VCEAIKTQKKRLAMGCCRKLFGREPGANRSVICSKWIIPLRVFALASILADVIFSFSQAHNMTPFMLFGVAIHFLFSWVVLNECKRSAQYHKIIDKFEKQPAAQNAHP